MDKRALLGQLACRGPQATKGQGVTLDHEDHKDLLACLESRVRRVPRAQTVRSELKEPLEIQV